MKKLFFFLVLFAISIPAFAKNIYVSQSGSGDGSSCGSSRSASWFNASGNWGSGTGQINGGDTVYLCGTITSALTVQTSGTVGSVITIDGAAATLSNKIETSNRSYFTIRNITWSSGMAVQVIVAANSTNINFTNLNLPGSQVINCNVGGTAWSAISLGGSSYIT